MGAKDFIPILADISLVIIIPGIWVPIGVGAAAWIALHCDFVEDDYEKMVELLNQFNLVKMTDDEVSVFLSMERTKNIYLEKFSTNKIKWNLR